MTRQGARLRQPPTALVWVARAALVLRAVLCEQAFAHVLYRGACAAPGCAAGARQALPGTRRGLQSRPDHRKLFVAGTPRAAADLRLLWFVAESGRARGARRANTRSPGAATPTAVVTVTAAPDDYPLSTAVRPQVDFIRRCLSLDGDLRSKAEWCLQGFLLAIGDESRAGVLQAAAEGLACRRA